jgi:membrane peptidoglycan carboxypeptidase
VARSNRPNPVLTLIKLFGAVLITGVLAAGFLVPYIGGLGLTARYGADKFLDTKCDLVESPIAQKTTIYASDGTTQIAQLFTDNRTVIPFTSMPKILTQALVGTEDRRFYEHHGVDLKGLLRAAVSNSGADQQGASTLTEQYVKQVRVYQAKTPAEAAAAIAPTLDRKIYEAQCALDLEKKYSKDEILEKYLNIAFFGENSYGIEAAANTYFGVATSALTLPQAALLVGLVQSPSNYDPFTDPAAAKARRDIVLDNMVVSKYIDQATADAAKATPITLAAQQPLARGCAYANPAILNVGFFCDYAYQWLTTTGGINAQALQTGGWKVVTSIDPGLQNTVQQSVFDQMPAETASAVVMPTLDPTTGAVTSMVTSRMYGVKDGDIGYSTDPLVTNAYAGTGSTYKYFTMLAALKAGADPNLTLTTATLYTPTHCSQKGTALTAVHNAGSYRNTLTLRDAAVESSNTYFVGVEDQVFGCDLSPIVNTALDLGVSSLNGVDTTSDNGQTIAHNVVAETRYSFTLGQTPTGALELASAYGTIANDGVYCPPNPIASITDANGQPVAYAKPVCAKKVDPLIAREALDILVGDTKSSDGTSTAQFRSYYSQGGSPIAGKTGTNNDADDKYNSALWFIGVTPHLVGATALVNPASPSTPILDAPGHVGNPSNAYGAVSAAIFSNALAGYLLSQPAWTWPATADVPGLINIPFVTGQSQAAATAALQAAGFQVFTMVGTCRAAVAKGTVATSSPKRAVPGETVMLCLSDGSVAAPTPTTTGATPGATPATTPTPGTPVTTPSPAASISVPR